MDLSCTCVRLAHVSMGAAAGSTIPAALALVPALACVRATGQQLSLFWGTYSGLYEKNNWKSAEPTLRACISPPALTSRSSFFTTCFWPPPSLVNFDLQGDVT